MQTYGELVYLILDELKLISDDKQFEEEHIIVLINQYRNLLLKQRYSDIRKEMPVSNLQSVNITLSVEDTILKSNMPLPTILNLNVQNLTIISSISTFWQGEFSFIDYNQFRYTGYNRWLNSIVYVTIGPDGYLYCKSNNLSFLQLTDITVTSIFENPLEVHNLSTPINETSEDSILDIPIPIEGNLLPILKEIIIKELSGAIYRPEDELNNANDNLNKVSVK